MCKESLPFFQKALYPELPKPTRIFKQIIHNLIITCFGVFQQVLNDETIARVYLRKAWSSPIIFSLPNQPLFSTKIDAIEWLLRLTSWKIATDFSTLNS